ncbi:hypothetical protein HK103_004873 [Boothiomyces macroporosus]|uniref:Bromo domain-containing protein n=1 Tax=Boothiomyces macroporosus TaxID=261099 RepID=A0AAD5UKF3_9FUNG|nr:hypothetical protein HK103_004873 [Boothiomyces macroporosus]
MTELKLLVVQLTIKLNHDWGKIKECLEQNNNPIEQCLEIYQQLPKEGLLELQAELSHLRIKEIKSMLANLERQYMALDQQSAQSLEFDSVQTIQTIENDDKAQDGLDDNMEPDEPVISTSGKANKNSNSENDTDMEVDPQVQEDQSEPTQDENIGTAEEELSKQDAKSESDEAETKNSEESEQSSTDITKTTSQTKADKLRPIAIKKQKSVESSDMSDLDSNEEETKKRKNNTWQKTALMIWHKIADHRAGNLFLKHPKDANYSKYIFNPLCLETVKSRIRNRQVQTTAEFHRDVMQVLANAVMYNNDAELYEMALELKQYTDVEMQNFLILHPE